MNELLYSLRRIRRDPLFVLAAVGILVCGVAPAAVIFTLIDATLLRPLPFPQADRLASVRLVNEQTGLAYGLLPGQVFERLTAHKGIETIGLLSPKSLTFVGGQAAETWRGLEVSASAVTLLGIRPIAGRVFSSEDYAAGDAVMISELLWQSRFGGTQQVLGRRIWFEGTSGVLVGVFPEGSVLPAFPQPIMPDFLQPGRTTLASAVRDGVLAPVVRLRDGVSISQAQDELKGLTEDVAGEPALPDVPLAVRLRPLREDMFWRQQTASALFVAAAAILLGVATVNLMHVFALRQRRNGRALAVYAASGATQYGLIRSVLLEGLVIACAGAALSFVVASWLSGALLAGVPDDMRVALSYAPLRQAGLVALAACVMALFASVPSVYAAGTVDIARVLASWRQGAHRSSTALSSVLAGAAGGGIVILLTGAVVMLLTVHRLTSRDLGFAKENTLVFEPRLSSGRGAVDARVFWEELLGKTQSMASVSSAALASSLPMMGTPPWGSLFPQDSRGRARERGGIFLVSRGYFETMRIPVRQGRTFDRDEERNEARVAVINEAAARALWPDDPFPLGKTYQTPWFSEPHTVVGIVADVRQDREDASFPSFYVPIPYERPTRLMLVVRARETTVSLARDVVAQARALDRWVVAPPPLWFEEMLTKLQARPAFYRDLLGVCALLGLLSALAGTATAASYGVSLRSKEIAIRMAVGADAGAIRRLVVQEAVWQAAIGTFAGALLSFLAVRALQSEVSDVSDVGGAVLLLVFAIVVLTVAAGAYPAAVTASRIDPIGALQAE